jgi:hypothetical protein
MASSDVDNTDAIKAYNDFAAKHTDVNFITLLIPGAAGGATVVSDYYNSLSVKPTGYVVDADADGFPSSLYSDIILYDAPDLVFVDQTKSKIMGAYIGDNTTDKYEAAFQAFLGSSPIARQTKAAASAN